MTEIDARALNLNLLPALEALLHEGSVSGAARRMHVGQSAMSHSLARLREVFADPLFVSSQRKLVPTPLAQRLAKDLPGALDQLGRVLSPPQPFAPKTARRAFRIATVDYFELIALADVLDKLKAHAPAVNLEIERFSPTSIPALNSGEIDLALIGEGAAPSTGLCRQMLPPVGYSVISKRRLKKLDLKTYLRLGHILVTIEGRREGIVDKALAKSGHTRRIALRLPHFTSAPLAVMASDHICTLPTPIALRARDLFGLHVAPVPLALPEMNAVALWSRRLDDDSANRWLRSLFLR